MSSKDKLKRFRENESFTSLYQPRIEELFGKDYALKGKWGTDVFKNSNPVILELGCGKGEYTVALSQMRTDRNFIGIDIKGARMWKGAKYAHEHGLPNVAFLRTRIEFITSCFAEDEVSEIWITFPDPQIKRERKRLTGTLFLERYRQFLKSGGIVHLKTDSRFLHEYTKALVLQNGLPLLECNNDIYGTGRADEILSIRTFYETSYLEAGLPITYIAFRLQKETAPHQPLKEPEWDVDYWKEYEQRGRANL